MSTSSGFGFAKDSIPEMTRIPGYDVAFPREQAAKNIWKPAPWAALGAAISKEISGVEAEAIVKFLRSGGPSAN